MPFWVTLVPLFKDTDQLKLYKKYIKEPLLRHGAVKIFFGSQWNLLVQRPSYVAQIFKHEDDYMKSGNQKKIPGSVLASFLGDNIISSHGNVWRLYQEIIKPGLQGGWSIDAVHDTASILLSQLIDGTYSEGPTPKSIPVQEYLQRYTIANLVQTLLGVDVNMIHDQTFEISKIQTRVKGQIFNPIFMNFPYLDTLGLTSREAARRDAGHFTDRLLSMLNGPRGISEKQSDSIPENQYKPVGHRLKDAWRDGRITE